MKTGTVVIEKDNVPPPKTKPDETTRGPNQPKLPAPPVTKVGK